MRIFGKSAAQKRIDELGNQLAAAEAVAEGRLNKIEQFARDREAAIMRAAKAGRVASELLKERDAARLALAEIAAMETTGANATVKRMAARARQELPGSAPVRAAMEAM